jgi:hypothetical protein
MGKRLVLIGLTAATLGMVCKTHEAQAQTMSTDVGRITALPQGLIGCGLLGAEAVILVEGAAGVRNRWILLGTGALGLVAGGVGGYFLDTAIDNSTVTGRSNLPMVSTATLAVGLGLIIPTAIMYVSATMYHPEDTHTETEPGAAGNVPLEESVGNGAGTTVSPSGSGASGGNSESGQSGPQPVSGGGGGGRSTRHVGPEALLNFRPGQFRLGLPAVSVGSNYSLAEIRQYGVTPTSEWRVPVLTATF